MRDVAHGVGVVALVAGMVLGTGAAVAQKKELSDKSVQTLMSYAWAILPSKFRMPTGKVIEVDKSKRDALVPTEVAREVIRVGYNSAQAQICELWEEQVANYDALMAREQAKKSWTDQQLLYITTLHRMTIHMAAGKLRVVEKGENELKVILEPIEPSKDSCGDDRKKKIKEAIFAYVKDAPKLAPKADGSSPTSTAAGDAKQPVPASAKK